MPAFLHKLLFEPRPNPLGIFYLVVGPLIVAGILLLPWPHDPRNQLPTALVWSSVVIVNGTDVLPATWMYPRAILRFLSIVGGCSGIIWLLR